VTTETIAGVSGVQVSVPKDTSPTCVTFLLPGSLVKIDEYNSTRDVLVEHGQVVISFHINVFSKSHSKFAQDVANIFQEYQSTHQELADKYNVVGHSVGAKIALILAAEVDPTHVNVIISLDPVDEKPVQFTKKNTDDNLTLKDAEARAVIITWATGTSSFSVNPAHNAEAVFKANESFDRVEPLVRHENAGHFAYTDTGGGMPGWMMRGGTEAGNKAAREDAHAIIRRVI